MIEYKTKQSARTVIVDINLPHNEVRLKLSYLIRFTVVITGMAAELYQVPRPGLALLEAVLRLLRHHAVTETSDVCLRTKKKLRKR